MAKVSNMTRCDVEVGRIFRFVIFSHLSVFNKRTTFPQLRKTPFTFWAGASFPMYADKEKRKCTGKKVMQHISSASLQLARKLGCAVKHTNLVALLRCIFIVHLGHVKEEVLERSEQREVK